MGNSLFLFEEYVTTAPGEPFRLFPFGSIFKNGTVRELTREIAARFKLPHFKPPIKRGGHAEDSPAVGHIVGLEVREDGLYAVPQYTEEGLQVLARGDFRYHSPEIIWEGGGLEDPATGALIEGPLIVGDALLHMPHLGEAAALYHVEVFEGEDGGDPVTTDSVQVPVSIWERFLDSFTSRSQEPPEPQKPTDPPANNSGQADEFAAQLAQRDETITQMQAQIQEMRAADARRARVSHFAASFRENAAVAQDGELHELLADLDLDEDQTTAITQKFNALAAQIDESALTGNVGAAGGEGTGDPVANADAEIRRVMDEQKVDYNAAVGIVARENPDLFKGVL